ncbi:hypothetical protein [Mycobacteroides abscessus]|uniref:hypothetical protein n=1 Tax=Mycobacteroides abscessus TaxID=36809 RepID=UPI002103CECD|nr:hypothetical protein [Mycobacteroides abscessus]
MAPAVRVWIFLAGNLSPGRWGISVFSCLAGGSVLAATAGVIGVIKAAQNPSCEGNEPITQPG